MSIKYVDVPQRKPGEKYTGPVTPASPSCVAGFGSPVRDSIPNILIVEDKDYDRYSLMIATLNSEMLKDVYLVDSCEDAIAFIEKRAGFENVPTPTMIILDLVMYDCDTFKTIEYIKQRLPFVPVVILSGSEDSDHIRDAYAAGATLYLVKPLKIEHLIRLVNSLDNVMFCFGRLI